MRNNKIDRRVQRTRKLLQDSLMSLIMEKGYDGVNVIEITDRANLGRATFYLHYRDKEDLLIESMDNIVDTFVGEFQRFPPERWALSDEEDLLLVFNYAQEHADLYRTLMSGQGGYQVSKRLHEHIATNIKKGLEVQIEESTTTPSAPLDFICNYVAGTLLAMIFWWLENDAPYPARDIVRMFTQISLNGRNSIMGLPPKLD